MKKGFTLIELLAVIAILSAIALIAIPTIAGIIENAKKQSFKNTAEGIINAGALIYPQDLENRSKEELTFTYNDGVESSSVAEMELKYDGQLPKEGTVNINTEGKVAIAIHNGKWCAKKGYDESVVTLTEIPIAECTINTNIVFNKIITGQNFSLLLNNNGEVYMEADNAEAVELYSFAFEKTSGGTSSDASVLLYNALYFDLIGITPAEFDRLGAYYDDTTFILSYLVYQYPTTWFDNIDDLLFSVEESYYTDPNFRSQLEANSTFMSFRQSAIDEMEDIVFPLSGEELMNNKKIDVDNVKDLAVTRSGIYFLTTDGKVLSIGINPGIAEDVYRVYEITEIPSISNAEKIFANDITDNVYVLLENKDVYAWGENFQNYLGNGVSTFMEPTPIKIDELTNLKDLVINKSTRFALLDDGTVKAWGWTDWGQIPITGVSGQIVIPTVIPGLSNVKKIYSDSWDGRFSYALHNDGTVSVWGYNDAGNLGLGHTNNVLTPTINPNFTDVKDIVLGEMSALVLSETGELKVTGCNLFGVFGNGFTNFQEISTPVVVNGVTGTKIFGNNVHSGIIDTNGNLFVAGKNEVEELIPEGPENILTFQQVPDVSNVQLAAFEQGWQGNSDANRLITIFDSDNKVRVTGYSAGGLVYNYYK